MQKNICTCDPRLKDARVLEPRRDPADGGDMLAACSFNANGCPVDLGSFQGFTGC